MILSLLPISIREDIARNPNTPSKILEQLATDEHSSVRWWVAQNPNIPPKALVVLATDDELFVRCGGVLRNPNTPYYIKKYIKIQKYLSCLHF